jgi:hypothetical protein
VAADVGGKHLAVSLAFCKSLSERECFNLARQAAIFTTCPFHRYACLVEIQLVANYFPRGSGELPTDEQMQSAVAAMQRGGLPSRGCAEETLGGTARSLHTAASRDAELSRSPTTWQCVLMDSRSSMSGIR